MQSISPHPHLQSQQSERNLGTKSKPVGRDSSGGHNLDTFMSAVLLVAAQLRSLLQHCLLPRRCGDRGTIVEF